VAFSQLQSAPNSFSAGALPWTPPGELTALPRFKGGTLLLRERGGEGKGKKGKGEGRRREERGEDGPP